MKHLAVKKEENLVGFVHGDSDRECMDKIKTLELEPMGVTFTTSFWDDKEW